MTNKAFEERAAAAVSDPRFRLADMGKLIREGEQTFRQLKGTFDQAEADATNFRLSEADRDAAAILADQTKRRMATMSRAGAALSQELSDRKASEKRQALEGERDAALKERDELAQQFRALVQPITEALPELLAKVDENAGRLKRAGLSNALDAEFMARGINSAFIDHSPVVRFTEMKLPNWSSAGNAWPPNRVAARVGVFDHKAAKMRVAEMQAEARATWGRYRLDPAGKRNIRFIEKMPQPMGSRRRSLHEEFGPVECDLLHTEADRLRDLGVKVDAVENASMDENVIFY